MKRPFSWDRYSDQPYQLKERAFKKAMRRQNLGSLVRTALTALLTLPTALLCMPFTPRRKVEASAFFALGIDPLRESEATEQMVEELAVEHLLVRFGLWEMQMLPDFTRALEPYKAKRIFVNIMQDREHIEDTALLETDIKALFTALSPYADTFQVGTTINRAKWGFFSVDEYLRFFETVQNVRDKHFPELKLAGPSVIDFEYHFTAHALFNTSKVRYDAVSALLYVDRRGAPENGQMGFDLLRKIKLLAAMKMLSPKAKGPLYLTEANWPITGTAPFAPTSEHECVDEEDYADYLVRYYLIAFASRRVDAVFWHQLVAPGYGLVDNRECLRKRTAYSAFKTMLSQLEGAECVGYSEEGGSHLIECKNGEETFYACWSEMPTERTFETPVRVVSRDGEEYHTDAITVGPSVQYLHAPSMEPMQ